MDNQEFSNTSLYQLNITIGLALTLSKLCAEKCRLFKLDAGNKLSETDSQCVSKMLFIQETCAAAINSNYNVFTNQLKEAINFEDSLGGMEPEE